MLFFNMVTYTQLSLDLKNKNIWPNITTISFVQNIPQINRKYIWAQKNIYRESLRNILFLQNKHVVLIKYL